MKRKTRLLIIVLYTLLVATLASYLTYNIRGEVHTEVYHTRDTIYHTDTILQYQTVYQTLYRTTHTTNKENNKNYVQDTYQDSIATITITDTIQADTLRYRHVNAEYNLPRLTITNTLQIRDSVHVLQQYKPFSYQAPDFLRRTLRPYIGCTVGTTSVIPTTNSIALTFEAGVQARHFYYGTAITVQKQQPTNYAIQLGYTF